MKTRIEDNVIKYIDITYAAYRGDHDSASQHLFQLIEWGWNNSAIGKEFGIVRQTVGGLLEALEAQGHWDENRFGPPPSTRKNNQGAL